jgi:hypothetical protein
MNKIIFLAGILSLVACKVQEGPSGNHKTNETTKKTYTMYGKIIVKSRQAGAEFSNSEMPSYYFNSNGIDYFIKLSECNISKEKIQQFINREIDIEGEIRTGFLGPIKTKVKSAPENSEEGNYVVIFKIIE